MRKTFWPGTMLALVMVMGMGALPCLAANTTPCINLTGYLQTEVNEIATLTAQMNYLQGNCDALGAALIASYIPDHQVQANALSALIAAQGGSSVLIQPQITPCLGSRGQIIQSDLQMFFLDISNYAGLKRMTCDTMPQLVATQGWNASLRQFNSLSVAWASMTTDQNATLNGLVAALSMEQNAICDMQSQAARLIVLGDQGLANQFLSLIPQHQQQAANLKALILSMCGNPSFAQVAPTFTLSTRNEIICHQHIVETQFINTYALPIASLPQSSLRTLAVQGQTISLASLYLLPEVGSSFASTPTPAPAPTAAAPAAPTTPTAAAPTAPATVATAVPAGG